MQNLQEQNYISFKFPHPNNEDVFLQVLYGDTSLDEDSVPLDAERKRVSVCTVLYVRVGGEFTPVRGKCEVMDVIESIHNNPSEWVKSMVNYEGT